MTKVFVNIGLSLDGYMVPEGMTLEHWEQPEYKNWGAKWGALMGWIINQQYFRENLKLGPGGETGPVNDMLRNTTERIGANIEDKVFRMRDFANVSFVFVESANVSDRGLETVGKLSHLKYVYLDSPALSGECIDAFKENHPECSVIVPKFSQHPVSR